MSVVLVSLRLIQDLFGLRWFGVQTFTFNTPDVMYCGLEEGTTSDVMIMIMMIVACLAQGVWLVMAAVSFEG